MSSCKFYHDRILAPIKCQKKEKKYLNTLFTVECIKYGFTFTKGKTLFVTWHVVFFLLKYFKQFYFSNLRFSPETCHCRTVLFRCHCIFIQKIHILVFYKKKNIEFCFLATLSQLNIIILPQEKFLQFDWLRAVVFQLHLKYLHVKITNLLRVAV